MRRRAGFVAAAGLALTLPMLARTVSLEANPAFEPGEAFPGGAATAAVEALGENAFSQPSGNLAMSRLLDFRIGRAVFRKIWSPRVDSRSGGLGPLYNARSCESCHRRDGRGHPPDGKRPGGSAVSMLLKLSVPADPGSPGAGAAAFVPDPVYGIQIQDSAIAGHRAEGRLRVDYKETAVLLAGGETMTLRQPSYRVSDLRYGPLHPKVMISPRIAPQLIGLGLLEAIPEAAILKYADPNDADGDGISGRAGRIWSREKERLMLARFGWKSGATSVLEQSAEAFALDIGISNWLVSSPWGDCTAKQKRCRALALQRRDGADEVTRELIASLAVYARNLAVPKRRKAGEKQVAEGKAIFSALGCARCHVPSFVTGKHALEPHLSHQRIWPYTDLLLHDMGQGLADNRPDGAANGREWRTPPLWGIGLTQSVSGYGSYLHDGRARTIAEAILWHGGEAASARNGFAALPKGDRESLLAFVNSL